MKRRPLILLLLFVMLGVSSAVWFLQSPMLTRFIRDYLVKIIPGDLGVDFRFNNLEIRYFPPRISFENPVVQVHKKNILNLPDSTRLEARSLDLVFRPFQIFSGQIRISEMMVKGGEIHVQFPKDFFTSSHKKKKKRLQFEWDELFRIYSESLTLEETFVDLSFENAPTRLSFHADKVSLAQWLTEDELGYEAQIRLSAFKAVYPHKFSAPDEFDEVDALIRLSPLGLEILKSSLRSSSFLMRLNLVTVGNLVVDSKLPTSGEIQIEGTLDKLQSLFPDKRLPISKVKAGGVFRLDSRFEADLLRMQSTTRMYGSLEVTDLLVDQWLFDKTVAVGSFSSVGLHPEVQLSSLKFSSRVSDRLPPYQPGMGGEVEFKNIRYRFDESAQVNTEVVLTNVHPHWLAPMAIRELFPLNFRTSGNVKVNIQLPSRNQGFTVYSDVDLNFQQLVFDNQKYGKKQKSSKIVEIPYANLKGRLEFTNQKLFLKDSIFKISDSTAFNLSGQITKNATDINADGNVDLKELGKLADIPIRGKGQLQVHVLEQNNKLSVDFKHDLKDAEYIRLLLGDLSGTIRLDDAKKQIQFIGVKALKNDLDYRGEGFIDLNSDEIHLDISLQRGNMKNFLSIFSNLTDDLWWFPSSTSGSIRGMIQIRDKMDLSQLRVTGTIQSPELQFAGERFQQVYLKGGFVKGAYRFENIRAEKYNSLWNASLHLSEKNEIEWWIKTQNLTLEDFDLISSLDFPIRGRMTLVSEGVGPIHQVESRTRIANDVGVIRGRRLDPSFFDIRSTKGSVYISSSLFGGEGSLDLIYHTDKSVLSSLRATATKLDLTPLILLLNSRLAQDPTLKAQVSGDLKLGFTAGKIELASGSVEVDQAFLSKSDRKTELSKPLKLDIKQGTFEMKPTAIKSPVGDLWVELSSSSGRLNGRAKGLADLGLLEYLFGALERTNGVVECDLGLRGTIKEPNFFGKFKTNGGFAKIRNIEQPIENIDARFNIDGGSIRSQQFTSLFAGGRLSGTAVIDLFIDRYPKLDINLFLSGNKLQVFPFQMARMRGRLKIQGDEIPYLISGDLNIENAISRESFFSAKNTGLKAARYTPPPTSSRSGDYPRFKLDINVDAEKNVFLKNEMADAEIKFKMKVTNNINVPRILGTAEVIQGRLIFKDRNFTITSANVIFDNPTTLNPKFSLVANTQVNDVKINLFASGSKEDWKVNLTSSPAMSEADLLSLLALGVTSEDVRRLRPGTQASLEQGQAANLVLNSLDFNRDVQDKTGLQIQVEEAINTQTATSIFRPQSQGDMVAAPKIVVRRRVGKRLQLSMGSTVGVGLGRQQEMNAEVKVNQAVSVIGVWNQFQGVDSNQNPSSYGLDLKVQKRFK